MSKEKQYFILLAGIDTYPTPITPLAGCIHDVDRIEAYIRSKFTTDDEISTSRTASGLEVKHLGVARLCRLTDEDVTYEQLVKGFREHLCQAGPEDVVWFHFSGHGSEQMTAEEFLDIQPNGKDQTLVCYQKEPESNFHLADKELAHLLHEIEISSKKDTESGAHIVVSLDCCHSGSGTRDFQMNPELKSRKFDFSIPSDRADGIPKPPGPRKIKTYLGNYDEQWLRQQKIEIPLARHVLLSACESVQLAGDLPKGGVFTSGLIEALQATDGDISYADLYQQTRSTVQKFRKKDQTPQFETLGDFNPYSKFLDGTPIGSPVFYDVMKEGHHWHIQCGAIHGIPLTSRHPSHVEVWSNLPKTTMLGTAKITGVGAQRSQLTLNGDLTLDPEQTYKASIKFLQAPPLLVYVHGNDDGVDLIEKVWDPSKNIQLVKSPPSIGDVQLEVEATTDHFIIRDRRTEETVIEWSRRLDNAEYRIIEMLGKIVKWERTLSLQNEQSAIKSWFNFEIDVVKDPRNPMMTISEPETIIEVNSSNFIEKEGNLIAGFVPYIRAEEKPTQNLYFYLLHLRSNYAISSYEGEVVYRVEEKSFSPSLEIPLLKQLKAWGLGPGEDETTSYFKLIATTEALQYQQILQSGLDGDRASELSLWSPFGVENDWYGVTLKVVLKRSESDAEVGGWS